MRTMRTVKESKRLEKKYYDKIKLMGIAIYKAFKEEININSFVDASESKNDQINNFNSKVKKILKVSPAIAYTMNSELYRYFNRQFSKNFIKTSFDIDLKRYYRNDKQLFTQITANSEDYIRKYGEETASWLRTAVRENYINGGTASNLKKEIKQRFKVTDNKAKLIARNESSGFIGAFDVKRGKDLGVERGVWRTMHDERVRSSHRPLNGKEFYLDKGLEANGEFIFPKEEINCRCYFDYILDN